MSIRPKTDDSQPSEAPVVGVYTNNSGMSSQRIGAVNTADDDFDCRAVVTVSSSSLSNHHVGKLNEHCWCSAAAHRRRREVSRGAGGRESLKWLFVIVALMLAGLSNWAVIAYTHDHVPRDPLPDITFSLVAEQQWASLVGDFCVAACLVGLLAVLVMHAFRFTILRRVVFIAACLYFMRSITLALTQLPSAYTNNEKRCREKVESKFSVFLSRLVEQTIRFGFQSKDAMLCGDLLFSGHSLIMVTCALSISYYLPRPFKRIQWLAHLLCIIGMIAMVVSRTHYSIDVVIAYWLTNFVFRVYHAYCEIEISAERHRSILYSWWPCRIIGWLEENVATGRLDNRIDLPWKRRVNTGADTNASTATTTTTNTMANRNEEEDDESSVSSETRHHQKHVSISSSSTFQLPL